MRERERIRPWVALVNVAFLAGGVALLVHTLDRVGTARLLELARGIGAWIVPIVGVALLEQVLQAASQHVFMRPEQRTISFARFLCAHTGGSAINALTPGGKLGEVAKTTLLISRGPRPRVIAAVVRYNLFNAAISWPVGISGMALAGLLLDLPPRLQTTFLVASGVIAIAFLLLLLLLRRGLLSTAVALGRRLHVVSEERRRRIADRLAAIDRMIGAAREPGDGLPLGTALLVASRIVGWMDLYVILLAMDARPSFLFMVLASGLGVVLSTITSFVPLGVGVSEGGLGGLFLLLGAPAELGVAASLVRRARGLIVAALGLVAMTGLQLVDRLKLWLAKRRLLDRRDTGAPPP